MWVKLKKKQVILNVIAVCLVQENKRLFTLVGSVSGNDYGGVPLGKFVSEVEGKKCLKAFEDAIVEGKGFFDINKYKSA